MPKYIDLTGQTFGRLTVIRRHYLPGDRSCRTLWLCRCQCGNQTPVNSIDLRRGKTRSCGCEQIRDLTGQTFGRLTVLSRSSMRGQGARWWCRCRCGKRVLVRSQTLVNGRTRSCGCLKREATSRRRKRDRTGQTYGWLTVIGPAVKRPKANGGYCWLCRCRCGQTVEVRGMSLAGGHTTSCGCKPKGRPRRVLASQSVTAGTEG